ncbi:MAG: protein tyrosine phosphatase [Ignavibacteriae bacterium HGW-Ignavibacteriae-4]|jgi:arsenate reductase|nr:MAG: protein tyrosine phosphatase [Ignavibacteriae bacterium HGW-Ignavibacteriae-4]
MNLLILCTGNSCRSQIAEGLFRKYLGEGHNVYSAGIEAHGVNPNAIKTMAAIGIDISNHTSDTIDNLPIIEYDYVLTVCDNAKERCPILPGNHKKLHHSFPDPASAKGTEEEVAAIFASVRDEIDAYAKDFVEGLG